MPEVVCRSCSSPNVVPDAVVYDQSATTRDPLHISVTLARPQTTSVLGIPATQHRESAPLAARLCGDCGAVEFYAPDAARLWAAYRG